MAIDDILYTDSDCFEMEIIGVSGITNDILFDNPDDLTAHKSKGYQ